MNNAPIIRTMFGFEQDFGCMSHRLVWDTNGNYLGQFQTNMLDDYEGAPDELFLTSTVGLGDCLLGLTTKQMQSAEDYPIKFG